MKLIFAHDHRFVPVGDIVYSSGSFPATAWDRYLDVFSEVKVLCRKGAENTLKHREVASADKVSFSYMRSLSSPVNATLKRGQITAKIRAEMKGADACIVRLPSELGYAVQAQAKKLGIPCAVEVAGCPWDAMRSHGAAGAALYAPITRWRMRRAIQNAPYVLYVTDQFLQGRYPPHENATTVGCSNVMIPTPDPAVLAARLEKLAQPVETVKLGLVGSLNTRSKGIHTVFEALALQPADAPKMSFHVLGSGDPAPWIAEAQAKGVADRVHFDGTLPAGPQVLAWLQDIDLYLQPSLKEGLPRATIEAMSQACPALGTTCAGIPELLDADDLVTPGDAKALAKLLTKRATEVAAAQGDWAKTRARRNWAHAQNYEAKKLEKRRADFWQSFATYAARSGTAA